jgi:hypothetical protein
MGFGREEALQIKQEQENRRRLQDWQIERSKILSRESTPLWEALAATIAKAVQEFVAELPSSQLRANRENPHYLTVDRPNQPVVKLEVIFDQSLPIVRFTRTEQKADFNMAEASGIIGFEVQVDVGAVFLDSSRQPATAEEIAKLLLQPVFHFFKSR